MLDEQREISFTLPIRQLVAIGYSMLSVKRSSLIFAISGVVIALLAPMPFTAGRAWLAEHLAELIGALASAVALFFVAGTVRLQARQTRSQEVLTAFALARGDLETLSRTIAIKSRMVVETRKGDTPVAGKLAERQEMYDKGDRTAFAQLFAHGKKVRDALNGDDGVSLRHQSLLYVRLFESVSALTREPELQQVLLRLPLGRAYCALKIALDQDEDGRHLKHLHTMEPLGSQDGAPA